MKKIFLYGFCFLCILLTGCLESGVSTNPPIGGYPAPSGTEETRDNSPPTTTQIIPADENIQGGLPLQTSSDSMAIECGGKLILAYRRHLTTFLYQMNPENGNFDCFYVAEKCNGSLDLINDTEFVLSGFRNDVGTSYSLKFSISQLDKPVQILNFNIWQHCTEYYNGYWYYTTRMEDNHERFQLFKADDNQSLDSILEGVGGRFNIVQDRIYYSNGPAIWMCEMDGTNPEIFLDLSGIISNSVSDFAIANDHVIVTFDEAPYTVFINRKDHTTTRLDMDFYVSGYVENDTAYFMPNTGGEGLYCIDKKTLEASLFVDMYAESLSYIDEWIYFYTPEESVIDGIVDSEEYVWRIRPDGTELQTLESYLAG